MNTEIVDGIKQVHVHFKNAMSLFRFRDINSYTIDALRRDEIWAATPDSFNDPYDSSFVINASEVKHYLWSQLGDQFFLDYQKERKLPPSSLSKIVDKVLEEIYLGNLKNNRRTMIVASFSENISNEIMWSHYANQGRGFALEYDVSELSRLVRAEAKATIEVSIEVVQKVPELEPLFAKINMDESIDQYDIKPVIYRDQKYDATKILKYSADFLKKWLKEKKWDPMIGLVEWMQNNQAPLSADQIRSMNDSIVFLKNKAWSYEQEWRMVCPFPWYDFSRIHENHFLVGHSKPKAIYLGEFISDYDKAVILHIAKNIEIPVYKMKSDLNRKRHQLSAQPISAKRVSELLEMI
jgi:hypothetical protein